VHLDVADHDHGGRCNAAAHSSAASHHEREADAVGAHADTCTYITITSGASSNASTDTCAHCDDDNGCITDDDDREHKDHTNSAHTAATSACLVVNSSVISDI
jgi:hypothetical protein